MTNTMVEIRMRVKVGVSFRECSFHLGEQLFIKKKSRRMAKKVLQTFC